MNYQEIKSLLLQIDDPVQKLELVMDFGKLLSPIPDGCAYTEVLGCVSRVQICKVNDNFFGMADSALVRGILFIILSIANDKIKNIKAEFDSLNLKFGASRLNGIESIIKAINNY
ncbi:MAG: SufE family protein [Alphaproteobacteria bacterium]|nr:SufE family protein [Alphaproteobacteria bacterium]